MTDPIDSNPTSAILVLVEWNGRKPSSTFYNRLHDYGLYSRRPTDDGEMSLLEWRANQRGRWKSDNHRGVILQEGAIVVSSMTLARDIAMWARDEGAKIVQIANMVVEDFTMDEKDKAQFEKLRKTVSKRGPKKLDEKGTYVITCLDEAESYEVEVESMPMMCTHCGGSNIQTRMGKQSIFQPMGKDEDSRSWWKKTRFANGSFEIPVILPNNGKVNPVPRETVPNVDEPDFVMLPFALQDEIAKHVDILMHILDVGWCVTRYSEKRRLDNRLQVLNAYAMSGGENYYSFVVPDNNRVDILDMCAVDRDLTVYL